MRWGGQGQSRPEGRGSPSSWSLFSTWGVLVAKCPLHPARPSCSLPLPRLPGQASGRSASPGWRDNSQTTGSRSSPQGVLLKCPPSTLTWSTPDSISPYIKCESPMSLGAWTTWRCRPPQGVWGRSCGRGSLQGPAPSLTLESAEPQQQEWPSTRRWGGDEGSFLGGIMPGWVLTVAGEAQVVEALRVLKGAGLAQCRHEPTVVVLRGHVGPQLWRQQQCFYWGGPGVRGFSRHCRGTPPLEPLLEVQGPSGTAPSPGDL